MISTRRISHWIVTKVAYVSMSMEPQNIAVTTCAPLLKTLNVEQAPSKSKYIRSLQNRATVHVQQRDALQV